MKEKLEAFRASLEKLVAFAEKYPELEDIECTPMCGELPTAYVWCFSNNRDQVLAGLGKLLGTSGWTTQDTTNGKFFDWIRVIDDVQFTIYQAQPLEAKPVGMPVPPTSFPLQLEDVAN